MYTHFARNNLIQSVTLNLTRAAQSMRKKRLAKSLYFNAKFVLPKRLQR